MPGYGLSADAPEDAGLHELARATWEAISAIRGQLAREVQQPPQAGGLFLWLADRDPHRRAAIRQCVLAAAGQSAWPGRGLPRLSGDPGPRFASGARARLAPGLGHQFARADAVPAPAHGRSGARHAGVLRAHTRVVSRHLSRAASPAPCTGFSTTSPSSFTRWRWPFLRAPVRRQPLPSSASGTCSPRNGGQKMVAQATVHPQVLAGDIGRLRTQ